ncbi:hypothetical protein N7474_008627 [Penicillium riverlandense]|uniref:uncharacterized protein n=1 Tax=Penicillium riverlandense TaxID=1903569 RepID=UPI00254707ED|nr:uncharacterized protein N7474_008627 [Penicillium riverlandense]KAJ5812326.1 hypothetical protein N7474_008627 [Penicillium riverlandense]
MGAAAASVETEIAAMIVFDLRQRGWERDHIQTSTGHAHFPIAPCVLVRALGIRNVAGNGPDLLGSKDRVKSDLPNRGV